MGYPSLETVQMFVEIANRDGLEEIIENMLLKNKELRMLPLLSYFKQMIVNMIENELYDEADGYSSGFLSCLDIFRRQINSEVVKLEDIEIQLANMCGWSEFLEIENLKLRNEVIELTRRNKELQKMPTLQSDGNFPGPT